MSFDKHSSFADLTQRSQYAFKFELRAGSRGVFTRTDEPSVPLQDGVWQSGSRHLAEGLAAQSMADFAERGSLSI
jgi:hypothetical protein